MILEEVLEPLFSLMVQGFSRKIQRFLPRYRRLIRMKRFQMFLKALSGLPGEVPEASWTCSRTGQVINVPVL